MKVKCICQECEKEFFDYLNRIKNGYGKFCSMKCYAKWRSKNIRGIKHPRWNKIKQICQICNKEFEIAPSVIKKGQGKICSNKCKVEWQKRYKIKLKCKTCGEKYQNSFSKSINNRGKFCSRKCYGNWRSKYRKGKNNPNWKGGKIKTICKTCGKILYRMLCQIKDSGNFCSYGCSAKSRKGKNSHYWKGGISKGYQKHLIERQWDKIRKQIYKRDNYRCKICGVFNIRLNAHHIIPWRISHDDNLNNLITTCNKCHRKLEARWNISLWN